MSHHLDSPLSRQDPRLNLTDQYVFDAPGATILVMSVNTSLAGAKRGFHPEARYEFRVHLDGAARESVAFRFAFDEPGDDGAQAYRLTRLSGDAAGSDVADGTAVLDGRTGAEAQGPDGLRAWAGEAADAFFLDLSLLDAMHKVVQHGEAAPLTTHDPATTSNTFAASRVDTIVLSVPHTDSELSPGRAIAMWSTTRLATDAGGWRQINRAGLPMMWPIFRPDDADASSRANETHPADDAANYSKAIADLCAAAVALLATSESPQDYGARLAARILPDLLPYRIGDRASFDLLGFNGRRLSDNAPEVMFALATNSAVPTGLTIRSAPTKWSDFPFVIGPW
jgi:hypothetical protein